MMDKEFANAAGVKPLTRKVIDAVDNTTDEIEKLMAKILVLEGQTEQGNEQAMDIVLQLESQMDTLSGALQAFKAVLGWIREEEA